MKDKVLDAYEKLAKDYEVHVDTESGFNAYYERPAMMKLLPENLSGCTALDTGCAAGWYTQQLVWRGARVTAVDISPSMVEACKRRVGDQAEVFPCDVSKPLPFGAETFDLIISSLTLHYIDDWELPFQEFHRVMKPGGSFLFSVHHPFMDFTHFDRPDYFAHELLSEVWNKKEAGPVEMTFYRRPLQEIINAASKPFIIDRIVEPQPATEFMDKPEAQGWFKRWKDHLMTHPHFLIVKARKAAR